MVLYVVLLDEEDKVVLVEVNASNNPYHLKKLTRKQNDKVNYQIYTALEVFKVE